MPAPYQITIVSGDTLLAQLLQERLQQAGCRTIRLSPEPACEDALLILPQTWRQLHGWLPALLKTYAQLPYLIIGDLRVAGMQLSLLGDHPCMLLPEQTRFEEILYSLDMLRSQRLTPPWVTIKRQFASHMHHKPERHTLNAPTPRELECGCAVSLGLTTHQIAGILCIEEETVNTHIKSLYNKFDLSSREELGSFFEEAFVQYS